MSHRTDTSVLTRASHVCSWCGEHIPPKTEAFRVTWADGNHHTRSYFHPECHGAEAALQKEDYTALDEWYEEGCAWYHVRGKTICKG